MSNLGAMLRQGVNLRVDRIGAVIEQATIGPVLLRCAVAVAALVGFAVTWPLRDLASGAVLLPIALALGAALAPRSLLVTTAIVAMVGGYLYNIGTGTSLSVWRPIVAAALIYIVHSGAAFASMLPFNAVTSRGLFGPFALRIVVVIVIAVVFGLGILAVPDVIGNHRLVSAAVAGMVAMVAVAGYVAHLGRRERSERSR